ncbi:MAG: RNA-binding S4 domain-containing protein [Erythrobacter sp.]|nr:RNA-binding S4 domain-containing protein [Erythrobacter sp.]NCQ64905.1 RNA-binding S4 domain-containing protein [Alphaproteobacteria bacterium]
MRLDLALCRLRFVRTRSAAREVIESGHMRVNGIRVERVSQPVSAGDVLTIPRGDRVAVIRIEALPERRGPPAEARSCYTPLDRAGTDPLAAPRDTNGAQGNRP